MTATTLLLVFALASWVFTAFAFRLLYVVARDRIVERRRTVELIEEGIAAGVMAVAHDRFNTLRRWIDDASNHLAAIDAKELDRE